MTVNEKADFIKKMAALDPSIPMFTAVQDTVDEYYNRIFIRGQLTDGGTIQYQSDNDIYINTRKNSPKQLDPIGKTGKSKFASGKDHKTTYFDSYKAFKAKIGKSILELFGSLQSAIGKGATKTTDNTYVLAVSGKEADKIEGLQYGNGKWDGLGIIFNLSKKEKEIYKDTFTRNYIKQLNDTANN